MDIISNSLDLLRVVFLLGAVLALVYKKKFGVTPGGVIVPGTLAAILFSSFVTFAITIAIAVVVWVLYTYTFGRYAINKRWASLVTISIAVALGLTIMATTEAYTLLNYELALFSLIVPGLIAIGAQRYSMPKVLAGTLTVTAAACLGGLLLAATIPYHTLTSLSVQLAAYTPLTLLNPYLVLPLSLITAMLIYYRFGIRGGGYLVAPFLAAVIVSSPLQALLLAAGIALSYFTVQFIQKRTFVIGLERFVLSLFCGYFAVTLMDILATYTFIPGYRPAPLVLIIAVAVITNDLCLQRVRKTVQKGLSPTLAMAYLARIAS